MNKIHKLFFVLPALMLAGVFLCFSQSAYAANSDYAPSGLQSIRTTELCGFLSEANNPLSNAANCSSNTSYSYNDAAVQRICDDTIASEETYIKQTCAKYEKEKKDRAKYTLGDFQSLCSKRATYKTNKTACEQMEAYLRTKDCPSIPSDPKTNQLTDFVSKCKKKTGGTKGGPKSGSPTATEQAPAYDGNECAGAATFFKFNCGSADQNSGKEDNPIFVVLLTIVNVVAFGVSLLVIGGIVYGGILYASASDNSGQTQKAISTITNSIIGLVLFSLLWVIINFIVPGGLIG